MEVFRRKYTLLVIVDEGNRDVENAMEDNWYGGGGINQQRNLVGNLGARMTRETSLATSAASFRIS